jgi:hypothetical protein
MVVSDESSTDGGGDQGAQPGLAQPRPAPLRRREQRGVIARSNLAQQLLQMLFPALRHACATTPSREPLLPA